MEYLSISVFNIQPKEVPSSKPPDLRQFIQKHHSISSPYKTAEVSLAVISELLA